MPDDFWDSIDKILKPQAPETDPFWESINNLLKAPPTTRLKKQKPYFVAPSPVTPKLTPEQVAIQRGQAMGDYYIKQYSNFMTEVANAVQWHAKKYGQKLTSNSIDIALSDTDYLSSILGEYEFSQLPVAERTGKRIKTTLAAGWQGVTNFFHDPNMLFPAAGDKEGWKQWSKTLLDKSSTVAGGIAIALFITGGIQTISALRKGVIGQMTDSVKVVNKSLEKTKLTKWKYNGVAYNVKSVTPKNVEAIGDLLGGGTYDPKLGKALKYLTQIKGSFPEQKFAFSFQEMVNGYLTNLPYLSGLFPHKISYEEKLKSQIDTIVSTLHPRAPRASKAPVGFLPPTSEVANIGNAINKLTSLGGTSLSVETLSPINSITMMPLTMSLNEFTSTIKGLIPAMQAIMNTYPTFVKNSGVSKEQLNNARKFLSDFRNEEKIENFYNKYKTPVSTTKAITKAKVAKEAKKIPTIPEEQNIHYLAVAHKTVEKAKELKLSSDIQYRASQKFSDLVKKIRAEGQMVDTAVVMKYIKEHPEITKEVKNNLEIYKAGQTPTKPWERRKQIRIGEKEEVKRTVGIKGKGTALLPKGEAVKEKPVDIREIGGVLKKQFDVTKKKVNKAVATFKKSDKTKKDLRMYRKVLNDNLGVIKTLNSARPLKEYKSFIRVMEEKLEEVKPKVQPTVAKVKIPTYKEAKILPKGGAVESTKYNLMATGAEIIGRKFSTKPEVVYNWAIKHKIDLTNLDQFIKLKTEDILTAISNDKPLPKPKAVKEVKKPTIVKGKIEIKTLKEAIKGINKRGGHLQLRENSKFGKLKQDGTMDKAPFILWGKEPKGKNLAIKGDVDSIYKAIGKYIKKYIPKTIVKKPTEVKTKVTAELAGDENWTLTNEDIAAMDNFEKATKTARNKKLLERLKTEKFIQTTEKGFKASKKFSNISKQLFGKELTPKDLDDSDMMAILTDCLDTLKSGKITVDENLKLPRWKKNKNGWDVVDEKDLGKTGEVNKLRQVHRVLKGIGVPQVGQHMLEATGNRIREEGKTYEQLLKLEKEVKKTKLSKAEIFDMVEDVAGHPDMPPEVRSFIRYWDPLRKDLAKRQGLPEKLWKPDYVPHYFTELIMRDILKNKEDALNKWGKVMEYDVPKEKKNPKLSKRLGRTVGLKKDVFYAVRLYVADSLAKIHYDPVIEEINKLIKQENIPAETSKFLKRVIQESIIGRPTQLDMSAKTEEENIDKVIGTALKKIKINHEPRNVLNTLSNMAIMTIYDMYLGAYPLSAIKNFFQKLLVYPVVSNKAFMRGMAMGQTVAGRAFVREHSDVYALRMEGSFIAGLDESLMNLTKHKFHKTLMYLFRAADLDNVRRSFLAGYYEAKSYILPENICIKRGDEVATRTQYLYSKLFRPAAFRSNIGRVLSTFTSWPLNFMEYLKDIITGNVSDVYTEYFKANPEKLNDGNKKLIHKTTKGVIKYLILLIVAGIIQKNSRVRAFEYTGITSIKKLAYWTPTILSLALPVLRGLIFLYEGNIKSAVTQFKKLNPTQQVSFIRTLKYLGVWGDDKDILRAFFLAEKKEKPKYKQPTFIRKKPPKTPSPFIHKKPPSP